MDYRYSLYRTVQVGLGHELKPKNAHHSVRITLRITTALVVVSLPHTDSGRGSPGLGTPAASRRLSRHTTLYNNVKPKNRAAQLQAMPHRSRFPLPGKLALCTFLTRSVRFRVTHSRRLLVAALLLHSTFHSLQLVAHHIRHCTTRTRCTRRDILPHMARARSRLERAYNTRALTQICCGCRPRAAHRAAPRRARGRPLPAPTRTIPLRPHGPRRFPSRRDR